MDNEILVRTFEAQVESDGRNLDLFCVPFDSPAQVADPPDYRPYREAFQRGAFTGATRAANRVLLDFEHHVGMGSLLGHGDTLEERDDGLYGRFRVTEHPDGDKALALVRDGVLSAVSIAFRALRSQRDGDGIVQRLRVHLDRVSLCRVGAYPEAQVLAVRTPPVLPPIPPLPDALRERLEAQGVRL